MNLSNQIRLAGCVIYNNKRQLLLIHRDSLKRTQWELPGGKIDKGEESEKTAQRELLEELGVKVRIIKKIGEKSFTEDGFVMHYIWFLAKIEEGTPALKEEKFDDMRYFDWKELRSGKVILSENAKNLVEAYFEKRIVF